MKVLLIHFVFNILFLPSFITCNTCENHCSFQLVESNPDGLFYDCPHEKVTTTSTFDALSSLINEAEKTLLISSYYWNLKNGSFYSDEIFERLCSRESVNIRIVQNIISENLPSHDTKILQDLRKANVQSMDLRADKGISHSKFLIADEKHFYLGSANMDLHAFDHHKELGILVKNCQCLAKELTKVFEIYSNFVRNETNFEHTTSINLENPLIINSIYKIFFSFAPPTLKPHGWTNDLDAIKHAIINAKSFVYISVMRYVPLREYSNKNNKITYWHEIDTILRKAAIENKVAVKLLVSYSKKSKQYEEKFLKSLMDITDTLDEVDIKIKRFIMPTNMKDSFMHSKYMVTDQIAYIGTSNWSGDYFTSNTGNAFVLEEEDNLSINLSSIRKQLKSIFERDWNSRYAVPLVICKNTTNPV